MQYSKSEPVTNLCRVQVQGLSDIMHISKVKTRCCLCKCGMVFGATIYQNVAELIARHKLMVLHKAGRKCAVVAHRCNIELACLESACCPTCSSDGHFSLRLQALLLIACTTGFSACIGKGAQSEKVVTATAPASICYWKRRSDMLV